MIYYFGKEYLRKIRVKTEEVLTKYQYRTWDNNERIFSLLQANDSEETANTSIISRYGANEKIEVAVRVSNRNRYDSCIIVAAIPFKGVLLNSKLNGYRFRFATVEPISAEFTADFPCLKNYDKMLYAIIEPATNMVLDPDHAKHRDFIAINIYSKIIGDAEGIKQTITITPDATHQNVKVVINAGKPWSLIDPEGEQPIMPYSIFMRNDKSDKSGETAHRPEKTYKKPRTNSTGASDKEHTGSFTDAAGSKSFYTKKILYKTHRYDDGNSKYPAKSKKQINNMKANDK